MKRKSGAQAIETHDISQRKYPMPGTDLGDTNAIPFNEAQDVDLSGGRQPSYCLGRGDDCSHFSYLDRNRTKDVVPAENPTRMKEKQPAWMTAPSAAPVKARK